MKDCRQELAGLLLEEASALNFQRKDADLSSD